jgi:hypothetical protein
MPLKSLNEFRAYREMTSSDYRLTNPKAMPDAVSLEETLMIPEDNKFFFSKIQ